METIGPPGTEGKDIGERPVNVTGRTFVNYDMSLIETTQGLSWLSTTITYRDAELSLFTAW